MNEQPQPSVFNPIWHVTLSAAQYWTVFGFIVFTGLTLVGFFIWSLTQQKKYDPRYRLAINAGLTLTAVAALSYVVIFWKLVHGYAAEPGTDVFFPRAIGLLDVPARYLDWAITVPLLVVELVGLSALALRQASKLRLYGASAAFLMIVTGYLGEVSGGSGAHALLLRLIWGLVSTAFFVFVYVIIIYTVRKSTPKFAPVVGRPYTAAMIVLLAVWFVYPLLYVGNGFGTTSTWAVTAQIGYCVADVIAKVGFGLLLQRVARLRSLESAGSAQP